MKFKYILGLVTPFIMLVLGLLVYNQVTSANSLYHGFLQSIGYYKYIYNPRCIRMCLQNWPHALIPILLVGIPGFLSHWFVYRHWSEAEQDMFMRGLRMGFFVFIGIFVVLPVVSLLVMSL